MIQFELVFEWYFPSILKSNLNVEFKYRNSQYKFMLKPKTTLNVEYFSSKLELCVQNHEI